MDSKLMKIIKDRKSELLFLIKKEQDHMQQLAYKIRYNELCRVTDELESDEPESSLDELFREWDFI